MDIMDFLKENVNHENNGSSEHLKKLCSHYLYSFFFYDKKSKINNSVIDVYNSLIDDDSYVILKMIFDEDHIDLQYGEVKKSVVEHIVQYEDVTVYNKSKYGNI